MAGFRTCLNAAAVGMVVLTVAVTVLEMEVFYSDGTRPERLQRSQDIMINPAARLPNEGRLRRKNGGKSRCAGVRGQAGFVLADARRNPRWLSRGYCLMPWNSCVSYLSSRCSVLLQPGVLLWRSHVLLAVLVGRCDYACV